MPPGKVTQATAAEAEESAAVSEDLNAQATTSLAEVQKLGRLVGESSIGAGARAVSARRSSGTARTRRAA
jgi:hypothetical protein